MGGPHLSPLFQSLGHEHPHGVHRPGHEGMDPVSDGIVEGREPDACGKGSGLVVNEDDLGLPLPPRPAYHPRLHHVQHVGVAVVVVPHVPLVEPGNRSRLVWRSQIGSIPLRHDRLAVRIQGGPEHEYDVVQDRPDLRVVSSREKVVRQLDRVLVSSHLGGVYRAVDVDDGLPLPRQRPRFLVRHPGRMGEAVGDLPVAVDLSQVLRRGDQCHEERPVFRGPPHLHQT